MKKLFFQVSEQMQWASFADYCLSLHKTDDNVNKVTLHMHNRKIDITYKKAEDKE